MGCLSHTHFSRENPERPSSLLLSAGFLWPGLISPGQIVCAGAIVKNLPGFHLSKLQAEVCEKPNTAVPWRINPMFSASSS